MPENEQRSTPSMGIAALYYASLGWRVFPLRTRAKIPATEHGCLDATTDREQIRAWWARWPSANVGIATGEGSGLLVIDLDGDAGERALAELVETHGALPAVPEVTTGRGRHLYFAFDARVKNSAKRLPQIDTRSTGGYVVAPPSIHPDGRTYLWAPDRTPREVRVQAAPEWLIEKFVAKKPSPSADPLLEAMQRRVEQPREDAPPSGETRQRQRQQQWVRNAISLEAQDLARVGEGARGSSLNVAAYKLGGYLPSGLVDESEMEAALVDASTANGLVAKDGIASVRAAIRRVLKDGSAKPRAIPSFDDGPPRPAPPSRGTRDAGFHPPGDDAPPPTDDDLGGPWGEDPDDLPPIFDSYDEDEMARLADEYLAPDPELYQRGGMLVQVLRDDAPGAGTSRAHQTPRITPMEESWLRALSTRRIRWMRRRPTKNGETEEIRIKPPRHAIAAIRGRRHWKHIRKLEGVTITPIFTPNGEVLVRPGYDATTGVLFEPYEKFLGVPDAPTRQDVDDALEALRYVVCDVPFERAEHEAAFFAAVLTPLARYAFHGPAPLFLIDANTPGTGKGLLAKVIGLIAIGATPTIIVQSRDEAEERKRITSVAMEGDSLVCIDNVEGKFGSPAMCAALTSAEWSDRVLGGSTSYKGPLLTTWLVTANNATLATDMIRRTAHIRLVTNEERPEERTKFTIPELETYVRTNRAKLVRAALTILRGWHLAGRPKAGLTAWGSFEGWSAVVREAIVWAGLPDPALTRTSLREVADSSTDQHLELVNAMVEVLPPSSRLAAGELLVKAKADGGTSLREALESYTNGRPLSAKAIGRLMLKLRGRIVDGRRIEGEKDPKRKQWIWWVARADGQEVEVEPSF